MNTIQHNHIFYQNFEFLEKSNHPYQDYASHSVPSILFTKKRAIFLKIIINHIYCMVLTSSNLSTSSTVESLTMLNIKVKRI